MKHLSHSFRDYHEFFIGERPFFFDIEHLVDKAYLTSINKELVNAYNAIKLHPNELRDGLLEHHIFHDDEFHSHVRNDKGYKGMVGKATKFMYLNGNGICSLSEIDAMNTLLKKATITKQHYFDIHPKKKDLVLLDMRKAMFEEESIYRFLQSCSCKGAYVLLLMNDSPPTRTRFKRYGITTILSHADELMINKAIIIRNYTSFF